MINFRIWFKCWIFDYSPPFRSNDRYVAYMDSLKCFQLMSFRNCALPYAKEQEKNWVLLLTKLSTQIINFAFTDVRSWLKTLIWMPNVLVKFRQTVQCLRHHPDAYTCTGSIHCPLVLLNVLLGKNSREGSAHTFGEHSQHERVVAK